MCPVIKYIIKCMCRVLRFQLPWKLKEIDFHTNSGFQANGWSGISPKGVFCLLMPAIFFSGYSRETATVIHSSLLLSQGDMEGKKDKRQHPPISQGGCCYLNSRASKKSSRSNITAGICEEKGYFVLSHCSLCQQEVQSLPLTMKPCFVLFFPDQPLNRNQ